MQFVFSEPCPGTRPKHPTSHPSTVQKTKPRYAPAATVSLPADKTSAVPPRASAPARHFADTANASTPPADSFETASTTPPPVFLPLPPAAAAKPAASDPQSPETHPRVPVGFSFTQYITNGLCIVKHAFSRFGSSDQGKSLNPRNSAASRNRLSVATNSVSAETSADDR